MRNIVYGLMLILGICGIASFFLFPLYSFDNELIKRNNVDLSGSRLIEESIRTTSNKKEKEELKRVYKNSNIMFYAILNEDADLYYEVCEFNVLNKLYEEETGNPSTLNASSKPEDIKNVREQLISDLTLDVFNQKIKDTAKAIVQEEKSAIMLAYPGNAYDLEVIANSDELVLDSLFMLTYGSGLSESDKYEFYDYKHKKGFYLTDLITSYKNVFKSYKDLWNSEEYAGLGGVSKLKSILKDSKFYNPLPLLTYSLIILIIFIGSISYVFLGIKGIRGKKYPHSFIRSIVFGALCFLLFFVNTILPLKYYLSYHYVGFSSLYKFLMYGEVGFAILINFGIFCVGLLISIIGRFCPFGIRRGIND